MPDVQKQSPFRRSSGGESLEFIRISGADACSFLQGQLSADMNLLSQTNPLDAAICNLQGRVVGDLRLALAGEDIIAQSTAGMTDTILATLKKYAVFSKVSIEADTRWAASALIPDSPSDGAQDFPALAKDLAGSLGMNSPQPGQCASSTQQIIIARQQPFPWLELWSATGLTKVEEQTEVDPLWTWPLLDALAGRLRISPALAERYTPAQLNYDQAGLINFKKGCYTGQEVVARMHYRGKAKKRLALLVGDAEITGGEIELTCLDRQLAAEAGERFSASCLQHQRLAKPVSGSALWPDAPLAAPSAMPDQISNVAMTLIPVEFMTPGTRFAVADLGNSSLTVAPLPYTVPYTE